MAIKLVYAGIQECCTYRFRLWHIMSKEHPSYRSTLTLAGLAELGIVPTTQEELNYVRPS